MLVYQHRIKYSIDIGVDFLLRFLDEKVLFSNESNIKHDFLASLCLAKNITDIEKLFPAFRGISKITYLKGDSFFILMDKENNDELDSLASLIFLKVKDKKRGLGYANSLVQREIFTGQTTLVYMEAYELTKDEKWLKLAKKACQEVIEIENFQEYWDVLAVKRLERYCQTEDFIEQVKDISDLGLSAICGELIVDWEDKTKELLSSQTPPSDQWHGGGFRDENEILRVDLSEKNIVILKKLLSLIKKMV